MGADSGIEWTDDTVNFWWGCDEVSPACDLCYARRIDAAQAKRFGKDTHWNEHPRRLRVENAAAELARNNRRAIKEGKRRRQFINSMSDFFEGRGDLEGPRLHALDSIRQAEHCDCLLLTKRPHLVPTMLKLAASAAMAGPYQTDLSDWLAAWVNGEPPANVQVGTTAENQEWLEARFPYLMAIPARVRFLSCEPLLGPLSVNKAFDAWVQSWPPGSYVQTWPRLKDYLHHVIVGGESGDKRDNHARPMHPAWARGLRDECQQQGVPFHFKQWGDWAAPSNCNAPGAAQIRIDRDGRDVTTLHGLHDESDAILLRAGKQKTGRLLDGRTWDELPRVAG